MSQYDALWRYIRENGHKTVLTFAEVEDVLGFPINHAFLNRKKELNAYGFAVGKISLKHQTVEIHKIEK